MELIQTQKVIVQMYDKYPLRSSTVYEYKATKCENLYNSRESHVAYV